MKTAKIVIDNKKYNFPILTGTKGPEVVDISSFYKETGLFTYDPGFTSTASTKSKITYIDGENGELLHRGYSIEHIAEDMNYLELCFLLFYGNRPSAEELLKFENDIRYHTMVNEQLSKFFKGFRRDAHPMATLVGVVGALSAFYHNPIDNSSFTERNISAIRLIAKMPTITAMAYKYSLGQPFVYPDNELDYSSNFLKMCFSVPSEKYIVDPILAKAIDRIFILHADHEQNASTSTVRLAGSSGANPFACIAAGIACLWGPAHGGANESCLTMLKQIGHVDNIPNYIRKAKDKDDPFRLMGFGHRVYKNFDPRAKVMKESADEVLDLLGVKNNPSLEVAKELEKIALEDEYFIKNKLYPNVDFYSGIILEAIGFPTSMFTPIFALSRTIGWISQWEEMITDKEQRIGRPRQLYCGKI